jgi:hypothetical protein
LRKYCSYSTTEIWISARLSEGSGQTARVKRHQYNIARVVSRAGESVLEFERGFRTFNLYYGPVDIVLILQNLFLKTAIQFHS